MTNKGTRAGRASDAGKEAEALAPGPVADNTSRDLSLPPQAERQALELAKLRLETRELSRPWLFKPPNLASVASIVVALVGVILLAVNGYFETTRKELSIQTHDLRIQKAQQESTLTGLRANEVRLLARAKILEQQIAQQNLALAKLHESERQLRSRATELDVPGILDRELYTPWDGLHRAPENSLAIGFKVSNAGAEPGKVTLVVQLYCVNHANWSGVGFTSPGLSTGSSQGGLKLVSWKEQKGAPDRFNVQASISLLSTFLSSIIENSRKSCPFEMKDCEFQVDAVVIRADGKTTNRVSLPFTSAFEWANKFAVSRTTLAAPKR